MEATFLHALRAQRPLVRARWEGLLRVERTTSPLANPDTLVHLLNVTLDDLFSTLGSAKAHNRAWPPQKIVCPCGQNPLLAYFGAGRQAMLEGLVLAQAATPALTAAERDSTLEELMAAFELIAQREIESFCAVCKFRETATPPPVATGQPPGEGMLAVANEHKGSRRN